jgi:hypothetical protein
MARKEKGNMTHTDIHLFAITHVDPKTGLRQLTFANQGRNHYKTREEAQSKLDLLRDDLRNKFLGDAADTLEVREVECYHHGDAKGIYFDQEM